MKKFLVLFFILFTFLNAEQKVVNVNACSITRIAFVKKLASEFSKRFKIKVNLNKQGDDREVVKALNDKSADVGFGCRELLDIPSERNLEFEQIGWGILAFMVNKKNKVDSITLKQAKDILTGKITNWKELGGTDAPIHIYLHKAGDLSGIGYSMREILFKNLQVKLKPTKYVLPSSHDIRAGVAKDPYAFAVGDAASIQAFGKVKMLKVNGIKPSKENLANKKYRAERPYYIYIPKKLTPEADEFISFALSKDGENIIKKGFAASISEGKRALELIEESAEFENAESDNEITEDDILAEYKGKTLKIFACGITRAAFAKEVLNDFSKKFHVNIETNQSGSDAHIIDYLNKKEADVALLCRAPFKEGKEKNLWSVQIGWGALSFIVNSKNRINNISSKQLKDILTGKIKNWKKLGGADAPIHLILRDSDRSGIGASLREIIFKDRHYRLNSAYKLVKDSEESRRAVISDPFAFGVDDVASSQRTKGVKILNIDGVAPTKRAILEGDYKFRRPFYACLVKKPDKISKAFVDYLLSDEGQKLISATGTANLLDEEDKDLNALDNYVLQEFKLRMQERQ